MCQQALLLQPDHAVCHSNLLLNEQYRPGVTLAGLAEAHAAWERQHAMPLRTAWRPFSRRATRSDPCGSVLCPPTSCFIPWACSWLPCWSG